jgi:hypothetical protein
MMHEAQYDRLARLTGLPNLGNVNDPDRLERLICAAWNMLSTSVPGAPLRFTVAYKEYAEAAEYRLENPEEIV